MESPMNHETPWKKPINNHIKLYDYVKNPKIFGLVHSG